MERDDVIRLAREFDGIVVVDEAYIHFADQPSMILEKEPNIVVLQTFSKAWGMAGLRVGLAFGSERVIDLMNRVKPPYNVSSMSQRAVLSALEDETLIDRWITEILEGRECLTQTLSRFSSVETVYRSDANFILVKTADAPAIYRHLIHHKIVIRDRSSVELCENCLRITIGTKLENDRLIKALESYNQTQ
jgi:histidinol-phosphate aminotransferase